MLPEALPAGRAERLPDLGRDLGRDQGRVALTGGLLAALIGVLYRSVLPGWLSDLWVDPNYSHGLLVPFVSAWLVYERRAQLAALVPKPAAGAITLVAAAIVLMAAGLSAAEFFVTRASLLVLLAGVVAFVLGWAYLRVLALPLAFLLFMVPLPALVFNAIAFPLQLLASQLAITGLEAVGVPALREGNVIVLPHGSLEVAEACSGLRSLVSLGATSVLFAVVSLRRLVFQLVLVASSIAIAVLTNGARVTGTGVLAYHYGPGIAEGFFHEFSGWVVFAAALCCLAGEAALLRRFEDR
jgi:exosortase